MEIPNLLTEEEQVKLRSMPVYDSKMVGFEYPVAVGLAIPVTWTQYTSSHIKDGRIEFSVQSSCPSQDEGTIHSSGSIPGNLYQKSICSECLGRKVEYVDQGEKLPESAGEDMHSLQERKFLVCCCVKRKVNDYVPLPGMPRHSWTDEEAQTFLLGLYIFGKNLVGQTLEKKTAPGRTRRNQGATKKTVPAKHNRSAQIITSSDEVQPYLFRSKLSKYCCQIYPAYVASEGEESEEELTVSSSVAAVPRRRRQLVLPSMDEEEDNVNPSVADDTVCLQEEKNTASSDDAGASHPQGGENVDAVSAGTSHSTATPVAVAAVPRRGRKLNIPDLDEDEDNANPSVADDAIHLQERENTDAVEGVGASHPQGGENISTVNAEEVISSPLGKRKSLPPPDADQGTVVGTGSTVVPSASAIMMSARPPSMKKMKVYYARPTTPSAEVTPTEMVKNLDASSSGASVQPLGLSSSSPSGEALALMPEVTSWCTAACTYLSNLPERLQMGFKDGQAALSEVSSLRSSLKKSEEQVALLAAHHDKIGSLKVDNARLQQTNESQKKEIDDLRKANESQKKEIEDLCRTQEGHNKELEELRKDKAELEKGQNDLRKKMKKMRYTFEQQVCDGGAAVLAVAKSHYRAIDASIVSSGFNCASSEEVETLMTEVKPDCTLLLQNLGLTSLSDDEE